jgi:hypothetical protein
VQIKASEAKMEKKVAKMETKNGKPPLTDSRQSKGAQTV